MQAPRKGRFFVCKETSVPNEWKNHALPDKMRIAGDTVRRLAAEARLCY